jgi:quercetin dioxygenase-like cupin family protein
MRRVEFSSLQRFCLTRVTRSRQILMISVFALATGAFATAPLGFIVNEILAKGVVLQNIHQAIEVTRNPDGSVEPWGAELHTHGATDVYVQHLALAPGGYSGWHTHPGILVATVVSGSIDFYDANCQKQTVNAGEVYFENGKVHGIVNTGAVNADLEIAYLIKHNAPRRIEADAPACAVSTPIP